MTELVEGVDLARTGPAARRRVARTITLRGRDYPVIGPTLSDPRLQLASVIITLQVLGQTVFRFDLSIPQILTAVLTCALLEVVITIVSRRVIAWPASAMLTGSGVAFVLRVVGTRHGDWWSTRGLWIFAATAAISLLSKYVVRWRGRHVFNPSNFGLVLCFLALGSTRVEPLDFWWANLGPALAFALALIIGGGLVVVFRTRMFGAAVAFWATWSAAIAVVALSGHCMVARWHIGPICGAHYWGLLVTSPEILVFLFFMITDPKTAPSGRRSRIAFGAAVAVFAAFLAAPQRTEFGTKVAVLGALAIACVLRPVFGRIFERTFERPADRVAPRRALAPTRPLVLVGLGVTIVVALLLALAGAHARPSAFTFAVGAPARRVVSRPVIAIPASEIPPVTISSQREFANALTAADAKEIAHDLLADLAITGRALRTADAGLAATAGDQLWLVRVDETIRGASKRGLVVVPTYHFDRMSVAVLKLQASQRLPEIDVIGSGTVRRVTYEGDRVVSATAVPFRRVFVVAAIGGHYLITGDRPR